MNLRMIIISITLIQKVKIQLIYSLTFLNRTKRSYDPSINFIEHLS
jgi:hypothetical protein